MRRHSTHVLRAGSATPRAWLITLLILAVVVAGAAVGSVPSVFITKTSSLTNITPNTDSSGEFEANWGDTP
jgi:hypothetical protein